MLGFMENVGECWGEFEGWDHWPGVEVQMD